MDAEYKYNGKTYTREDLEDMDFDDLDELFIELNNLWIQEDSYIYTRQVAFKNGEATFSHEDLLKKKGFLAFVAKFKGEVLMVLKKKRRSYNDAFVQACQTILDADTWDDICEEAERIVERSSYYVE